MKPIEEVIEQLSPELQDEVFDFARFLLEKKKRPIRKKMRLTWAGALREYKTKYTSVQLQKKAVEWWND